MKIDPTSNIPLSGDRTRYHLSIGVEANGYRPSEHGFGTNVGVGGRHLRDRLGLGDIPVRAATRNELRRLHRIAIAELLESYPAGSIYVRRTRFIP